MGSIRYEFEDFGPKLDALREKEWKQDRITFLKKEIENHKLRLKLLEEELKDLN